MQRDEVGLEHSFSSEADVTCSSRHRSADTNGSKHDDLHPERAGAGGDQLADAAEADDAEHLVGQLDAAEALALPPSLRQCGVRLGDVARDREQQPERVLGGDTMFEPGAFATMIPRRVAAATSTLSTPVPARPITFSRRRRARSARPSHLVALRTISAS